MDPNHHFCLIRTISDGDGMIQSQSTLKHASKQSICAFGIQVQNKTIKDQYNILFVELS